MLIGDHLFVSKPIMGQYGHFYTHHGIYIGAQQVIHYAGYANGFSGSDADKQVSIVSLARFGEGKPLQIRPHPLRLSRQAIVERARSRLGENQYNLIWRNCEHFATWCWTDEESSAQVRKATMLIGVTTAVGIITKVTQRAAGTPVALASAAVVGMGYGLYRLWDR